MAATVRQLAAQCGVSEQSIRNWLAKHEVAKSGKTYAIDETTAKAILGYYHADVGNDGCDTCQDKKDNKPDSQAAEIAKLQKQLAEQSVELAKLREQNEALCAKATEYADRYAEMADKALQLADQAQKLQAMSAQTRRTWRLPWRRRDDDDNQG